MKGYIIFNIDTDLEVARFVGGNQSEEEILIANNFDKNHNCISFFVEEGFDISDYSYQLGSVAITNPEATLRVAKEKAEELAKKIALEEIVMAKVSPTLTKIKSMTSEVELESFDIQSDIKTPV